MYLFFYHEHLVSQYLLLERAQQAERAKQQSPYPPPDKQAIWAALEVMGQSFQQALQELTESDLPQKEASLSAFSVGGLLMHCVMAVERMPHELASIRQGQNLYDLPRWIMHPLRLLTVQFAARRQTIETIGRRFDAALAAALKALETVHDHEWQEGAYFYDEGFSTIERVFSQQPQHLAEHVAIIRQILQHNKGYIGAISPQKGQPAHSR